MRKGIILAISLMLIMMLGLAGCSNSDKGKDTDKVYEMNFNSVNTSTHKSVTNAIEPWLKIVEEKSNGKLKVNVYHNAALGPTNTAWQDITGGAYDFSTINLPYVNDTALFPFTIGDLPFVFEDSSIASEVLEKWGQKYADEIFKGQNGVWVGVGSTDPRQLFTKKPVRKLSDIKGMKIRVGDRMDAMVVEAWGGIPVSMPFQDMYEGLSKNMLDGTLFNPVGVIGNRTYEVAPYCTIIDYSPVQYLFAINADTFNSWPKDLQDLFRDELGPIVADLYSKSYLKEMNNAFDTIRKEVGDKGEIIILSDEEQANIKAAGKIVWDAWVVEANKKGYDGEEMMDHFKKVVTEAGLKLPF